MSYKLIIGRQEEGHFSDTDKDVVIYRGHCDTIHDLDIPSVDIAHQIAKLCNVKCYAIAQSTNDGWSSNVVFETPDITAWDNAVEAIRSKANQDKDELCARINKLPIKYSYGEVAGYEIYFERSKAEHNTSFSNRVTWDLSAKMKHNKYIDELRPDRYRSEGYGKGKKRLHARFERDFKSDIEDQAQRDKLWDELPKIEARYKELKRQIENA